MKLKITIEVSSSETGNAIASGEIVGDLDIKKGNPEGQPILTVRMSHILDQVRETIYADSNV